MDDVADHVTVVTGTYGDASWADLARERAAASLPAGVSWIHAHAETLHHARNAALVDVTTPYVVHLDADDELAPGYLEAMLACATMHEHANPPGVLYAPRVQYVMPNGNARPARFPNVAGHHHDCTIDCMRHGNWLVVGTMLSAELARAAGGWRDFAWSEDWDLWLRCLARGASIVRQPEATYVAHVRVDSRNRAPDRAFKLACHEAIVAANFPQEATA